MSAPSQNRLCLISSFYEQGDYELHYAGLNHWVICLSQDDPFGDGLDYGLPFLAAICPAIHPPRPGLEMIM